MTRKTLEDKIRQVVFWTISLTLIYIFIGAFLVSDYPLKHSKFDLVKTYNLIKDALGLAAAFLAPVAAFVLFSDWRVEHQIKSTLQLVDDLRNLSFDIKKKLGFYDAKIVTEKEITTTEFRNREDRQILLWKINELERMNTKFLLNNQKINAFKNLQEQFKELADEALKDLHFTEYYSFRLAKYKNSIDNNENRESYSAYSLEFRKKFKELEDLSAQIELQVLDVQKSILGS
mgnify:CR=1 FL=1